MPIYSCQEKFRPPVSLLPTFDWAGIIARICFSLYPNYTQNLCCSLHKCLPWAHALKAWCTSYVFIEKHGNFRDGTQWVALNHWRSTPEQDCGMLVSFSLSLLPSSQYVKNSIQNVLPPYFTASVQAPQLCQLTIDWNFRNLKPVLTHLSYKFTVQ